MFAVFLQILIIHETERVRLMAISWVARHQLKKWGVIQWMINDQYIDEILVNADMEFYQRVTTNKRSF